MSNNKAQAVVDALLMIKEQGPSAGACGICYNVDRNIFALTTSLDGCRAVEAYFDDNKQAAFMDWPNEHNTGCVVYPVPEPVGDGGYDSMWLSGVAADARRDLLNFLITYFTKLAQDIT